MRAATLLAGVVAGVLLCACRAPLDQAEPVETRALAETTFDRHWQSYGTSAEGRKLQYRVFGDGPLTILLVASIHGNEEAGTPLLDHLALLLDGASTPPSWMRGVRLALIPRANPDGLVANGRHNARGVDLNRNFPARNFEASRRRGSEPLSEPESRALHSLIERLQPERVLSFHMPVNLIDYDGPARELARAMAITSSMEVKRLGGRPGSLGSWVGRDRGIPIVTVEFPASDHGIDGPAAWSEYGPMIVAAVEHRDAPSRR